MSQIVQVVSMLEVMISFGDSMFQSREVKGAVCSGDFEFDNSARGVSFCAASFVPLFEGRVTVLPTLVPPGPPPEF